MPVTTPVKEFTVAVAISSLLHAPPDTVFASVVVDPSHTDNVPVIAVGCAYIFIAFVAAPPQPVEYVIVAAPWLTPVITPEVASTDATATLLLVHVPYADAFVHVVVAPVHKLVAPVIEEGINDSVTVATATQGAPIAYDIVVVPAETAVTTPVVEFTVATPVLLLTHVPPATELLSVVVPPLHIPSVPVIGDGPAFTVSTLVAGVPQPVV